ncbi:MAG: hypothetical protein M5U34_40695 [Chloroflexi bacterium]|nr:hypothetical protein [Chloroflexota bacterium]
MFKRTLIILLLLLAGSMLLTAFFTASATTNATNQSTIVEYPVPTLTGGPQSIAIQAPGHVWFTLPQENAIGELVVTSTVDYTFYIHPVPTSAGEPYDLVYDGRFIWFTERAGNKLGQLDTITKIITEPLLTPVDSMPTSIDVAPNGHIWLTKPGASTGNISRYNPTTATFQNYAYSKVGTPTAVPHGITVVNDNVIGFTVPTINIIVELDLVPPQNLAKSLLMILAVLLHSHLEALQMMDKTYGFQLPLKTGLAYIPPGTLGNFLWLNAPSSAAKPTTIHYKPDGSLRQIWYVGTTSNHMGILS